MLALCIRKFHFLNSTRVQLLHITGRGGGAPSPPRVGVRRLLGPQAQGQSSLGPCAEPASWVVRELSGFSRQTGRHILIDRLEHGLQAMCLGTSTEKKRKIMTRKVNRDLGRRSRLTRRARSPRPERGKEREQEPGAQAAAWEVNHLRVLRSPASIIRKPEQDRRTVLFTRALTRAFAG